MGNGAKLSFLNVTFVLDLMAPIVLKIVIGGDGGVGKTTILQRFISRKFVADTQMTIGVQLHVQEVPKNGGTVKLALWDLGGQERFRFILPSYCEGACGGFVLFDMSDMLTIERAGEWASVLRQRVPCMPIMLVGTKNDLLDVQQRETINAMASRYAIDAGFLAYYSTSSKTGENVDEAIHAMIDHVVATFSTRSTQGQEPACP